MAATWCRCHFEFCLPSWRSMSFCTIFTSRYFILYTWLGALVLGAPEPPGQRMLHLSDIPLWTSEEQLLLPPRPLYFGLIYRFFSKFYLNGMLWLRPTVDFHFSCLILFRLSFVLKQRSALFCFPWRARLQLSQIYNEWVLPTYLIFTWNSLKVSGTSRVALFYISRFRFSWISCKTEEPINWLK